MCLAVPGKIIDIYGQEPMEKMAKVDFGGVIKEINISFIPEAKTGDYCIVHTGFALSLLDEEEAKKVFEEFDSLNKDNLI